LPSPGTRQARASSARAHPNLATGLGDVGDRWEADKVRLDKMPAHLTYLIGFPPYPFDGAETGI
jgi:hypothetical protein